MLPPSRGFTSKGRISAVPDQWKISRLSESASACQCARNYSSTQQLWTSSGLLWCGESVNKATEVHRVNQSQRSCLSHCSAHSRRSWARDERREAEKKFAGSAGGLILAAGKSLCERKHQSGASERRRGWRSSKQPWLKPPIYIWSNVATDLMIISKADIQDYHCEEALLLT